MSDDAWHAIERLGRDLGASAEAIRKWRARGVPAKWQLRMRDVQAVSPRAAAPDPAPAAGAAEEAADG